MVGRIGPLREMKVLLERAASSNCTVLISGETGTGKELVAEFVHHNSPRRNKPFVCINCAAIPDSLLENELFGHTKGAFTGAEDVREGLLTAADGGTIFLDEIGDMSPLAQAKILRVLERKEVCRLGGTQRTQLDIRFVAATNQDLEKMTSQGAFRRDLYFRLNVAHFHMLPLRERKADIPVLADYFGREFSGQFKRSSPEFSEECMRRLMQYEWPGNIRELKNLIESLLLAEIPEQIEAGHLPEHLRGLLNPEGPSSQDEREHLLSVLLSAKWNKSKAAEKLQWSRMTLYRKMAKYQIARSR
jgi:transcriptional regulator with PAS, ATPase and Fis domain